MTPEVAAYWSRMLTQLVAAVGETEARAIADEVVRRMGGEPSLRRWTVALLKVASERGTPPLTWLSER